jgi:chaperone BCS1
VGYYLDLAQGAYEQYAHFTQSNQFLGAAVAAFVLGIVGYLARDVPRSIYAWVKRQVTVSFELPFDGQWQNQQMFTQLTNWFHTHSNDWFSRSFSITQFEEDDRMFFETGSESDVSHKIISGSGTHWVRYEGKFYWYSIEIEKVGSSSASNITKKSLSVKTLGISTKKLQALIKMIVGEISLKEFKLYRYRNNYWESTYAFPRPLESVITNHTIKEDVVGHIQKFMDSRSRYIELGINYKLSFLFSGDPGTGKTSLVKAIASHYCMNLCVLNVSGRDDDAIQSAIDNIPKRAILLLEDIDCASDSFLSREDKEGTVKESKETTALKPRSSTLSGILNLLDGVNTPDSLIIMMTTNYPDRIDSAILRKGRTDHHVVLTSLDDKSIRKYASHAYGGKRIGYDGNLKDIKGCDLQGLIFENENIKDFELALIEAQKLN